MIGQPPAAYVEFLRSTNGAEGPLIQPEGYEVRLHSIRTSVEVNPAYQIQEDLPQLWMIGDDGGDYGICLDRSRPSPDEWPVVEVPLGARFADQIHTIAPSFAAWQQSGFAVVHGWGESDDGEWRVVLDAIGPSTSRIASIVAEATGLNAPAALALVREEQPTLLRAGALAKWRLERLQAELMKHGASASVRKS